MFSPNERRLLGGLAVVTVASWGRFFATESLKVDESYPGRVAGYALLAALVAGWAVAITGWRGLLEAPPGRPRPVAYAALGVASAMLPMLSNDVFSLMAYGTGAAQGHDVYGSTGWIAQSPFYELLGQHWNATVCVYGPGTLLATLPAAVAKGNAWVAIAVLRLLWLIPVVAAMELTLRSLTHRPGFHAMVWLNPLWLVEGPGQLHADLLGMSALAAGVALHLGGKVKGSAALYALAFWSKYTVVLTGLWFWWTGSKGARLRRGALMAWAIAVVGVVLYAPFWRGTRSIVEPLEALGRMNPGGSFVEVGGILVQLVTHGGAVTPPDMPVQTALELDRATKHASWQVLGLLARVLFVVAAWGATRGLRRRTAGEGVDEVEHVAAVTGALTVALLTLYSPRFQCWYLLAALPFFGLTLPTAWRRWWVLVVAVSVPVDFACVLERSSPVYPVWGAVTTGAQVATFLAWFSSRYLRPEPGAVASLSAATAPAAPSPPPRDS